MLTGPLQNNKRPSFSGHETFPMRYGWLTKMMDYFDPNQQKNDLIINMGAGDCHYLWSILNNRKTKQI